MLEEARYSKRIGYSVGVPCLPANKPKRSQELEERLSSFIVIIIWGFRPTYLPFFLLPLHPGARLRLLLFCFRAHRAWAQRGALNVRMCIGAQIKWCSRSESRRGEEGERERERAAAAGSTQRLRYTAKLSTYNLLFIRRQEGKRVFSPFLHFFTFAFALSLSPSLPLSLVLLIICSIRHPTIVIHLPPQKCYCANCRQCDFIRLFTFYIEEEEKKIRIFI